jgi:Tfp pilus assembly major pilin PilA
MSQQKVEKYKNDKKNRKKIIAKQKRMRVLRNCMATLVVVALVAFIGLSIYKDYIYKESTDTEPVTYSLSEKEISKVWSSYEDEAASDDETSSDDETTSQDESASEETTSQDEDSSNETASQDESTSVEND